MLNCCRKGCKNTASFIPELDYYAPKQYKNVYQPCIMNLPMCTEHAFKTTIHELDKLEIRGHAVDMAHDRRQILPDFKKIELKLLAIDSPVVQELLEIWKSQLHKQNLQ